MPVPHRQAEAGPQALGAVGQHVFCHRQACGRVTASTHCCSAQLSLRDVPIGRASAWEDLGGLHWDKGSSTPATCMEISYTILSNYKYYKKYKYQTFFTIKYISAVIIQLFS